MKLKLIVITVLAIFSMGNAIAQSKKEQIAILTHKIDSLNSVLNNERSLSLERIPKLNSEIDLISKKLIAANDELNKISKDFDKKRVEAESIESENKKLEADLNSLEEENSRLQFELDSLIKANCVGSLQPLNKDNVPPEVDKDQACTDCKWYAFDSDIYEEGDLIFIHKLSVDELYFILCNTSYSLPLSSRKFKEGYTETDMPNGFGTLIFQDDSLRVVYNWANGGHAFGSEGYVEIFRSDKLIKKVYVRSTS
jgi:hypothetical protein